LNQAAELLTCENVRLRSDFPDERFSDLQTCENLLQNVLYFAGVIATEFLMLIAYARVSTDQQETELQLSALKAAGAEKFFEERASGGHWDRTELHRMLDQLRPGDVVAVYKLDRLSRSLKDLLLILERLEKAGAGFRSLTEAIDTTTPAGRMMTQIIGSFAEFERAMIRERTRAGLAVAQQHGRIGGRRPKLNADQKRTAVELITSGQKCAADVARIFGVHPATIGRLIARS
jgi:DNA invertase Pin-like site-specific DNA recombinase